MLTPCFCLLLVRHQITSGLTEFQQDDSIIQDIYFLQHSWKHECIFLFNWPVLISMTLSKVLLKQTNELLFIWPAVKDHDGKPGKHNGLHLKKPTNPYNMVVNN